MRESADLRYRSFLYSLVVVVAALACNVPDVRKVAVEEVLDGCSTIDREKYELYSKQLGQTPEDPMYPDHVVYEACFVEHTLTSVRMSEGYREIPAGTYTGETLFYTTLEDDWDGGGLDPVCTENTVRVVIDSDGAVQGEIRSICYTQKDTDNEEMQTTHHQEVTAAIEGEVLDTSGQVSIAFNWHSFLTSPQWETTSLDNTVEPVFDYHLHVSGDQMTLTPAADVEAYYTFSLNRE